MSRRVLSTAGVVSTSDAPISVSEVPGQIRVRNEYSSSIYILKIYLYGMTWNEQDPGPGFQAQPNDVSSIVGHLVSLPQSLACATTL